MTLKEIRKGSLIREYEDHEYLPKAGWARLIGCSPNLIETAVTNGGINFEIRPSPHPNQKDRKVVSVKDFPKLIEGFSQISSVNKSIPYWAMGIELSVDFEIRVPSGAKLRYEYPQTPTQPTQNT